MKTPHDNIVVGAVTLIYSEKFNGWITPSSQVIRNPIVAERRAELMNDALKSRPIKVRAA